jgi:molybdopterin-guanine dinucleotide biosynthesis protein A
VIKKSNFIIIGSTGRNTGKTEFACRVIKRFSKEYFVVGVKVTAIDCNEGGCPRGGNGCGVCSSLTERFTISEELKLDTAKDTSRMLKAGAHKVLWLKVDKKFLLEGVNALLKLIPDTALVVCESNTLRTVLEPGLFLVIKNISDNYIKKSAANVIELANKVIGFQDLVWDFLPGQLMVINNQWAIKEKATAIILAGGKSSRMGGTDKSLLPVNGKPLILNIVKQLEPYFDEIIIGANNPEKYEFMNLKIVPDIEKEKGPLMGILSCLRSSSNEVNFVTACDIPVMNIHLIREMINLSGDVDIVMPVTGAKGYEPLFAIYKKSVIDVAEIILKNNGRRIIDLLGFVKSSFIDLNDRRWYQNLNKKEDYLQFISKWDSGFNA